MSKALRTFLAIPIMDIFSTEINHRIQLHSQIASQVNWANRSHIHLTLHFFGNVPVDETDKIHQCIEPLAKRTSRFKLSLDQLGFFPNKTKPRILWLGVSGQIQILQRLASDVTKSLNEIGYPVETRVFTPHITIGRVHKQKRILWDGSPPSLDVTDLREVCDLALFQSEVSEEGNRYEITQRYPLKND